MRPADSDERLVHCSGTNDIGITLVIRTFDAWPALLVEFAAQACFDAKSEVLLQLPHGGVIVFILGRDGYGPVVEGLFGGSPLVWYLSLGDKDISES